MQRIWGTATDGLRPAPGASVTVYVAGSPFTLATIYDPNDGNTPTHAIGNPMTADGQGRWCCAVDTGYYTVITTSGAGPQSIIPYIETLSVPSIAQQAGALTSTRVPFANVSGALIDNANFTYTVGTGLKVNDATASSSTTTGALVVTGGVGVGGVINAGAGTHQFGVNAGANTRAATNGAAGTTRSFQIWTAGNPRWVLAGNSTAETGGNAGTDFFLGAYDDAGSLIDLPIQISRIAGGIIVLSRTLKFPVYAFASLPSGSAGMRAFVNNNSATPAFLSAANGGGATTVPVFHDGTSWKVG